MMVLFDCPDRWLAQRLTTDEASKSLSILLTNNFYPVVLPDGNTRIGSTQVDTDSFCHVESVGVCICALSCKCKVLYDRWVKSGFEKNSG